MCDNQVRVVALTIDSDDIENGAADLLRVIRPAWKIPDVKFKVFTAGITNKLVCCHWLLGDDKDDVVLVRVYGENSDLLIDRNLEMINMRVLHASGRARPLFCSFDNGIAYGFVHGRCTDENSVRTPDISRLIAREMARFHCVNPEKVMREHKIIGSTISTQPCLFHKLNRWLEMFPDTLGDPAMNERLQKEVPSKADLMTEVIVLRRELEPLGSPVAFCHNDLLLNNIVYNEHEEKVYFIDFEYAAYNYIAFDIGDHFTEYAGVDTVDYSLYPDKDHQLKWLRHYLEYKSQLTDGADVSDEDVESLYVQANKFALAANLFWGVWAMIQVRYSAIDFDYLDYGITRFNEYFARKTEFLSL